MHVMPQLATDISSKLFPRRNRWGRSCASLSLLHSFRDQHPLSMECTVSRKQLFWQTWIPDIKT
ncbi:hypothetical protein MPTK1_5g03840 [Marchantia polymorpha subsp. ruderalis]|uniref:Uncharacterized protein n=2 Tax=Marchantia polymorpha TaxID=3197 RepID=A0AAF6BEP0_MARPO|nr:hypothetical protein MARPO_0133s0005 [Marchantia polymorpha]BBN10474.1 hypothetical protein Mp_5g03840 [Marchantia polymorpha subsp. ruderalis]|eukprot:PTQ29852.1 hypothetical protein MARPO_0133s0005 [Marchantia polymorpha]